MVEQQIVSSSNVFSSSAYRDSDVMCVFRSEIRTNEGLYKPLLVFRLKQQPDKNVYLKSVSLVTGNKPHRICVFEENKSVFSGAIFEAASLNGSTSLEVATNYSVSYIPSSTAKPINFESCGEDARVNFSLNIEDFYYASLSSTDKVIVVAALSIGGNSKIVDISANLMEV